MIGNTPLINRLKVTDMPLILNEPQPSVPDIGALYLYRGRRYRVTGWACIQEPQSLVEEDIEDMELADLLRMPCGGAGKEPQYRWCTRREATHVTGAGICGCRAPIDQIEVIGMVPWSADSIAQEREKAERRGALGLAL